MFLAYELVYLTLLLLVYPRVPGFISTRLVKDLPRDYKFFTVSLAGGLIYIPAIKLVISFSTSGLQACIGFLGVSVLTIVLLVALFAEDEQLKGPGNNRKNLIFFIAL